MSTTTNLSSADAINAQQPGQNTTGVNEVPTGTEYKPIEKRTGEGADDDDAIVRDRESDAISIKELEKEEKAVHYPPLTPDAYTWACGTPIGGAWAPILYVGLPLLVELSKLMGRSLVLPEVQHLVQPDGPVAKCTMDGIDFQPVKYLGHVPKSLKQQLESGKTLTEIELPYNGCYFLSRDGRIKFAYSGAIFRQEGRRFVPDDALDRDHPGSPLFMNIKLREAERLRPIWGLDLPTILEWEHDIKFVRERKTRLAQLVQYQRTVKK